MAFLLFLRTNANPSQNMHFSASQKIIAVLSTNIMPGSKPLYLATSQLQVAGIKGIFGLNRINLGMELCAFVKIREVLVLAMNAVSHHFMNVCLGATVALIWTGLIFGTGSRTANGCHDIDRAILSS